MTASDAPFRNKLDALAKALKAYHRALLQFARGEYEFLHGPVKNEFELYSLVMNNPDFQWLRPLSGLMATLDDVLDSKSTTLTQRNVDDVKGALGLLYSDTDARFAEFRAGYARAKSDPSVRETEAKWRELLNSMEA